MREVGAEPLVRAGLLLSAMGVLSLFTVRGYLEVTATAPDITYALAAFLILTYLATLRRAPRWSGLFALGAVVFGFLYANVVLDGTELGTASVVIALVVAYRAASPAWRPLVVGGFSLWTPALTLYSFARPLRVETPVAVAAIAALGLFVLEVFRGHPSTDERLRRVGIALAALAISGVIFERHNIVSSSILAPDDVLAVISIAVLVVIGLRPRPPARAATLAAMLALAVYALVCVSNLLGKGYHSDAVVSPHRSAELLLEGKDPYVAFDMTEGLARFGLEPSLATHHEDGSVEHELNYPAGAVLVVVPFVAAGFTDIRWIYLAEVMLFGALLVVRARVPWRPYIAALFVGDTLLRRQYTLAGIDPTWALGVAVSWLLWERRNISPLALGVGAACRQPAWFFVPFYLLAAWRTFGPREAARRGALVAAAFGVLNLPFVLWDPLAWWRGAMGPIIDPLVPYGIGLVHFAIEGVLPLFPRGVYAIFAIAAFAFFLALLWRRWRDLPNGALSFPLMPLFFAWRSLSNYFVFVPLFTVLRDEDLVLREAPQDLSNTRIISEPKT